MREEAVVRGGEPGGELEQMGVVREPVHPAAPKPTSQVGHVCGDEVRALEDQHHVPAPALQARGQPGGQGPSQQGAPAAASLLAAAHLTTQGLERRGEGQAAAVIATVERGDEHHPQTREGHTST